MIQKNDQEELLGENRGEKERMKKGQILEGVIEKVEFPNKGLVYVVEEDQYVLVKNGIPGQKIRFGINKFKHGRQRKIVGSAGTITVGDEGTGVQFVPRLRRMHVSDDVI